MGIVSDQTSQKPPKPPTRKLGRYEVGPKIAGGGMAIVYLGRRRGSDGIERVCALKVIRDELATDTRYVQMFLDEARILSRLSVHPNIIQTYDYGISDDGRYIAMELLLGRSLADACEIVAVRNEHVPYALAAWMCARIADGLHHAHELRDVDGTPLEIVHRDVNPTNIFVSYDTSIKLLDFGIARANRREFRSAAGIVKGKLPYLAPEQLGDGPIDRRVDIFQLGTTLWEATTGRRLFKRETDLDTVRAVQKCKVPDAREIQLDYPEGLWRILTRALARHPSERYETAADLGSDLDLWLDEDRQDEALVGPGLRPWLDDLFPGEAEKHARWLAKVMRQDRGAATTMMPPRPLPDTQEGSLAEVEPSAFLDLPSRETR